MDTSKQNSDTTKTDAKNLWKKCDVGYQFHATIFSTDSTTESDETISYFKKVNIMDLEKEKKFKENFKNWTSGNKNIDEFIQQSQLNAFYCSKCLEWIPFENFENVTYLTRVGFSKIYSADWPEGKIGGWDIENQEWIRTSRKVALKSLINSSNNISNDFLNEIKYYISGHFHFLNTILCFGITQDPNTKDYMMVLQYCEGGILRNTLVEGLKLETKIEYLFHIIDGLSGIHDAGNNDILSISDLGMCQPVNDNERKGIYGVIPYMAPEVLRGYQYTKAADIYSFGIIMNELMSEEIPYNDTMCIRDRNRPTAKELHQILGIVDVDDKSSEIYSQIKECEKIKENKLRNRTNENKSKNLQTHPQAIY
ncbi:kinase-like domain-containing protein [Rhizophagus irregularis DAOM 181602=DAOM 197198]|uniref:Kinase-like domain-containing protein n=1 Tax=Rhizophagus irregularis (strain DAOM 181602 / DAOM 197198 / MUCL 43194) TaxID=747089 RepID=A0A2P4P713_RHIID|nr:kinase-like domain-containing protein [Rhizophagus irregularis DAOM 181602=DAOM 197198]POG61164.1 kinase-like domain-containing protein [Rhizophagus irregularis DAOM 181602=DAOM 197198]|eukprot:XP_025168030.1 kinase-like domain-containing protein [Rhizophagus irregularis DAOM 181602=DAOM 197198]